MKSSIAKSLMIFVSMLLVFPGFAQNKPMYDVDEFDIAGVRLGMNMEQAISALSSYLEIAKDQIRIVPAYHVNPVLGEKTPESIVYKVPDLRVQVNFTAAIPIDELHPMRVNSIYYEAPRTDQNMHAIRTAAFEKYGMPTNGVRENDYVGMRYDWCTFDLADKNGTCSFDAIGAVLTLNAPKLQVYDPRPAEMVKAFLDKKKTSKPKF